MEPSPSIIPAKYARVVSDKCVTISKAATVRRLCLLSSTSVFLRDELSYGFPWSGVKIFGYARDLVQFVLGLYKVGVRIESSRTIAARRQVVRSLQRIAPFLRAEKRRTVAKRQRYVPRVLFLRAPNGKRVRYFLAFVKSCHPRSNSLGGKCQCNAFRKKQSNKP